MNRQNQIEQTLNTIREKKLTITLIKKFIELKYNLLMIGVFIFFNFLLFNYVVGYFHDFILLNAFFDAFFIISSFGTIYLSLFSFLFILLYLTNNYLTIFYLPKKQFSFRNLFSYKYYQNQKNSLLKTKGELFELIKTLRKSDLEENKKFYLSKYIDIKDMLDIKTKVFNELEKIKILNKNNSNNISFYNVKQHKKVLKELENKRSLKSFLYYKKLGVFFILILFFLSELLIQTLAFISETSGISEDILLTKIGFLIVLSLVFYFLISAIFIVIYIISSKDYDFQSFKSIFLTKYKDVSKEYESLLKEKEKIEKNITLEDVKEVLTNGTYQDVLFIFSFHENNKYIKCDDIDRFIFENINSIDEDIKVKDKKKIDIL